MTYPLVSIIVPVYRVEAYLSRCIGSLLNQTFTNLEIILVDDGSPDRCPQMCDQFAQNHKCIRVIHKENGGLASARLAGFLEAQGEYILFVDSDDYIHPQMVEKLINAIQRAQAELALCSYYVVNEAGTTAKRLPYNTECISGRDAVVQDYVCPLFGTGRDGINIPGFLWIRLMKRSLIQASFFGSERKFFLEDHYFDLLYADGVNTISVVNEPLYYYCFNEASLSNRYRKNKWEMYWNLYDFYVSYAKNRNLTDIEPRLNSFLVSAFHASVDNAVLSGSYGSFVNEMHSIMKDERINQIWLASKKVSLPMTQRITLSLCKAHQYRLLYALRLNRLHRTR